MGTTLIKEQFGLIGYGSNSVNSVANVLCPLVATKVVSSPDMLERMNGSLGALGYVMDNLSEVHIANLTSIRERFPELTSYLFTDHVSIALLYLALRLGFKDVFVMPCTKSNMLSLSRDIGILTNIECYESEFSPGGFMPEPEQAISHPLASLFELIEDHFVDGPSLENLSSNLHLSPSRISHMFKDLCGIGYSQYVLCRRLEESEYLLIQDKANITSIAFQLGFSNPSHFCRNFKDHIGITPTAYMKSSDEVKLSCLYKRYQKLRMELLPVQQEELKKLAN